jgi:hypothetical protein
MVEVMLNAVESEILIADWQGPYSWPGFETDNNFSSLPKTCGVYIQAFEYNFGGYIIYCAGHAKNIRTRFAQHERTRRLGDQINIFDIEKIKAGVRYLVWNGYSDWWKTNAKAAALAERQRAIGYSFDWGNEITCYQSKKQSLLQSTAEWFRWRRSLNAVKCVFSSPSLVPETACASG